MQTEPDGQEAVLALSFLGPASTYAPGLTDCTNYHYHGASAVMTPGDNLDTGQVERAMGVEPTQTAWKAVVLPLHHARAKPVQTTVSSCRMSAADWGADRCLAGAARTGSVSHGRGRI